MLALFAIALLFLGGCVEREERWETIHDQSGENACDSPVQRIVPLTRFDVNHFRLLVNFSTEFTVGSVDYQLLDPYNQVVHEKHFVSSGRDTVDLENPTAGFWDSRIVCPAGIRVNLSWHLTAQGLTRE